MLFSTIKRLDKFPLFRSRRYILISCYAVIESYVKLIVLVNLQLR